MCGPLPVTNDGNAHIIVIGDYFTKWKEAYAVPDHAALTVADKIVTELCCRYGCPLQLHSDQGREFESDRKDKKTPYRPQSDGLVERLNQLLRIFRHDNPNDLDDHLPYVLMAYRASEQKSTKCSPNLF